MVLKCPGIFALFDRPRTCRYGSISAIPISASFALLSNSWKVTKSAVPSASVTLVGGGTCVGRRVLDVRGVDLQIIHRGCTRRSAEEFVGTGDRRPVKVKPEHIVESLLAIGRRPLIQR